MDQLRVDLMEMEILEGERGTRKEGFCRLGYCYSNGI